MEWPGEEGVPLQTNRAWGQLFTELVPHAIAIWASPPTHHGTLRPKLLTTDRKISGSVPSQLPLGRIVPVVGFDTLLVN